MQSADSSVRSEAGPVARWSWRPATCDVAGALAADELARWLCGPSAPAPSRDELEWAFGFPLHLLPGIPPSRLQLTLAVLRDAFPDDAAVRRWLRLPSAPLAGRCPLDLLRSARIERLEELAVAEWNRGTLTVHRARRSPSPSWRDQ